MSRIIFTLLSGLSLVLWFNPLTRYFFPGEQQTVRSTADSLPTAQSWPEALTVTHFAGADLTPSPACLAVAPSGEVFVGVDMIGSLGKDPGKGRIVRLVDNDRDGRPEAHTVFAMVDNPRGIIAMGKQVFVLHTVFSPETGKASGMNLVVFDDNDLDGIADGPPRPLIEHISSPKFLQSRGTDHATNGIRMGIDGWIYIAVGDFGFHGAVDRSGKQLTMLGGGIVRVRPDGTEMEIFSHGLRNIYDVAIDPYMNIFTRDNTNDGGGWNIRFSHQLQSGEYGYPVLFKHFTNEIIPALVDAGGGSGTGCLFIDDDRWPARYNQVPMMADWGRNQLYIHRIEPDGPSYRQQEEEFIKLSQITDVDIDGSGILYLSAWDRAGYSGNPSKGFIVRAVPKNWQYEPFPELAKLKVPALAALLKKANAVTRQAVQQELLQRPGKKTAAAVWKIAADPGNPLYARVAGMYTYAQLTGAAGVPELLRLTTDAAMREFALRALSDRKGYPVPIEPFLQALEDPSVRVRTAAIIGLGRLGKREAAAALLKTPVPAGFAAPAPGTEGPHATPNAEIIPAHLAVRSLVSLDAVDECLNEVGKTHSTLALWTLRYLHDSRAVDGLIAAYGSANDKTLKREILTTLSRLYKKEADYDGSWWWSTRPDTHGPYYKGITWESSPAIQTLLLVAYNAPGADHAFFTDLNSRHRMEIAGLGSEEVAAVKEETLIDLEKIRNKKGQVGESSIEDVMLAMAKIKGDPSLGKKLFVSQGCVACHSISKDEVMKGPYMGQIGSIMTREQIAESILKPNASISQGFASVLIQAKDDKSYMGFITEESAGRIVLRDITGQVTIVPVKDIISRQELETSMMPPGLASSLSYEEFASLLTYLSERK